MIRLACHIRRNLLLNHDGAMSDFLDGIGGECYRAGEEHEIPINERQLSDHAPALTLTLTLSTRLGLMGPSDKLGMSSFVEEGQTRLDISAPSLT